MPPSPGWHPPPHRPAVASRAIILSDAQHCFHCDEPLPAGAQWETFVGGRARAMCCPGCAAVADAIVSAGLERYYTARETPAHRGSSRPETLTAAAFDADAAAARRVRGDAQGYEVSLVVEGATCAACMWLAERALARIPGVSAVEGNYAQRRMCVRWKGKAEPSRFLEALRAVGLDGWPYDPARAEDARRRESRSLLLRFAIAALGMMQVMMYALPAYLTDGEMTPDVEALMRWASLVLTLPVVVYSALPFFRGAWRDLRERRVGMDVPVSLGIGAAFAASTWATVTGSGAVYYDSITMFVCLLLGARYLEFIARMRAADSVERLARAAPAVAERVRVDGTTETVAVEALAPGDRVRVRPGATVPADGIVVAGEGAVDEQLLTGESAPVRRRAGDRVLAGAINRSSALELEVRAIGTETTLAGIVRLAERAASERPPAARMADRAASVFLSMLLVIAAGTAIGWALHDPARALAVTIAVLVVSCPCALSLATPSAYAAASGALAAHGVLATRPGAIETLARATHFVFDKTGTLTTGRLRVIEVLACGTATREECLAWAAALERDSEHAIGAAIRASAGTRVLPAAEHVSFIAGRGIEGTIAGRRVRLGRIDWVAEIGGTAPRAVVPVESGAVGFAADGQWLAFITLADAPRPDARTALDELQRSGAHVSILSGDRPEVVAALATALGIADARGGALPESKLATVRGLQREGAVVCMVGDGVNDAATLAGADVSIALGEGADLAHAAADFVLLSGRLAGVPRAAALARRTRGIVRQNLAWALAYNVLAVPVAVAGWLTPLAAGAGMALSSVAVVTNALRLLPRRRRAGRAPVASASAARYAAGAAAGEG